MRQVPKVIGETAAGEPIVEIRSVQLVLHGDASHFSRIVACSKCRRDVPGPPVLGPGDLDQPVHAVICKDCVRAATLPTFVSAKVTAEGRQEASVAAAAPAAPKRSPPEPTDDGRLAALERRIAELASAHDAQRSSLEVALDARTEKMQAELAGLAVSSQDLARTQAGLTRALDDTRTQFERLTEKEVEPADALDQRIEAAVERHAPRVDADVRATLEARIEALQAVVERETAATRWDLARLSLDQERLPAALAVVSDTIAERLAQVSTASTARVEGLEERLGQLGVVVDAEAVRAESESVAREQAGQLLLGMEQQLTARLDRLADQVTSATGTLSEGRSEVELLVAGAVEGPMARIEALHAVVAALESSMQQLPAALAAQAERLVHDATTTGTVRLAAMEEGLLRLQPAVEDQAVRTPSDFAPSEQLAGELVRIEEQLNARLDGFADRVSSATEADSERLLVLEMLVAGASAAPMARIEALKADVVALKSSVEQFPAALAARTEGAVERLALDATASAVRLEALEAQLQQLQLAADSGAARARSESTTSERAMGELVRIEEQLNERLDRLSDSVRTDGQRLQAVDLRVAEAVEGPVFRLEAQLADVGADLRTRVDQLHAALAVQADQAGAAVAGASLGTEEVRRSQEELGRELEGLLEQLRHLHLTVETEAVRAKSESTAREQAATEFLRIEEQLNERVDRLSHAARADGARLQAVELRVVEAVEGRLIGLETSQAGSRVHLESTLEQLQATLAAQADRTGATVDRVSVDNEDVRRELEGVREQLQQLQESFAADAARSQVRAANLRQGTRALIRTDELLTIRLERLAEIVAGAVVSDSQSLESLRRQFREEMGRLPEALESLRQDLQASLADALADARSSIKASGADDADRLQALEKADAERDNEVSDLYDLQGALDAGLGRLRSDLADLRAATGTPAGADDDDAVGDRVGGVADVLLGRATPSPNRGWRMGRRSEAAPESAEVMATVKDLSHSQQRLDAQLAALEGAAHDATAAAARASSQAASVSPLRREVEALYDLVTSQRDAVVALRANVDSLRRELPGRGRAATEKTPPSEK